MYVRLSYCCATSRGSFELRSDTLGVHERRVNKAQNRPKLEIKLALASKHKVGLRMCPIFQGPSSVSNHLAKICNALQILSRNDLTRSETPFTLKSTKRLTKSKSCATIERRSPSPFLTARVSFRRIPTEAPDLPDAPGSSNLHAERPRFLRSKRATWISDKFFSSPD